MVVLFCWKCLNPLKTFWIVELSIYWQLLEKDLTVSNFVRLSWVFWINFLKNFTIYFQESLLEIDEEEDTTDFCETFLVPDAPKLSPLSKLTNEHLESQWSQILHDRMFRHNKDLRLNFNHIWQNQKLSIAVASVYKTLLKIKDLK